MKVRRLNRVELLLPGEDIPQATDIFNEVLGAHLSPPQVVDGQGVVSTVDYQVGIEFFGPDGPTSPRIGMFDRKPRRGAIGPIVWEVDDYEATKAECETMGFGVQFEFGEHGTRQLHLDPSQLFGFGVTFTERTSAAVGLPSSAVKSFEKLELLVAGAEIDDAVRVFNALLGANLRPAHHLVEQDVLTTTDFAVGIELLAPASPASTVQRTLDRKGRGSIGPIVWEVADIDATKARLTSLGYRIAFEYIAPGRHQVHLDPDQLFGYGVTFSTGHSRRVESYAKPRG